MITSFHSLLLTLRPAATACDTIMAFTGCTMGWWVVLCTMILAR